MSDIYLKTLEDVLKKDDRLVSEDGRLLKVKVAELARALDLLLIKSLLSEKDLKNLFFKEIDSVLIFDKDKFVTFVENEAFLPDSYTAYKNKIGLATSKEDYLGDQNKVVLNWPYKDCVLEGGQDKEDQKRDEIFWNEILGADQRDVLLAPKVLTGFKRYDKDGEKEVTQISEDDNLLIQGNNLLALYTLKKRYSRKIKVIYIDPPFNPDSPSNTFIYNNRFNHSTWLTFMKNRLEIAKELLTEDGILIVAIDDNEFDYLGVLLKEIFNNSDTHCITIVHNPRGVQGDNFSYTHEYAFFVIPKNKKTIGFKKVEEKDIYWSNFRNWGSESLRSDAKNCFYPVILEDNKIIGFGNVTDEEIHPKKIEKHENKLYVYPIDNNGIERKWRYAKQSVEEIKRYLKVKKSTNDYEIIIGKDFEMYRSVWIDPRYDANEYGTKLVKSLVPQCNFDFPKSLWNVYDCLHAVLQNDKNAIVLDFFAGSGTTAHAVIELNKDGGNRKFILIEQMFYVKNCTIPRVKAVLKNENLNKTFVYSYIKNDANLFIETVKNTKNGKELLELLKTIKRSNFLSYRADPQSIHDDEFTKFPEEQQKKLLIKMVDKNKLYVNFHDMDDQSYKIDENTKKLNRWLQSK